MPSVKETRYVYDGILAIQERDGNNIPLLTYTRGTDLSGRLDGTGGIGGLLARTDNTRLAIGSSDAHAYYHADRRHADKFAPKRRTAAGWKFGSLNSSRAHRAKWAFLAHNWSPASAHASSAYLLSSRSLDQLQAEGMLKLKRGYWTIESRLHHCSDITMQEDLSRVRHPEAARTLGTIRRIVLSLANAAVDRMRTLKPKTKVNTKTYRRRFLSARQGQHRLHSLLFSKSPDTWTFGN